MQVHSRLIDVAEKINWILVDNKMGPRNFKASSLAANEIKTMFHVQDRKKFPNLPEDEATHIKIRIGRDILNMLGWKKDDRISVFQDPDDLYRFRLEKNNESLSKTYKLGADTSKDSAQINFKWNNEKVFKLMLSDQFTAEHAIWKGTLIIDTRPLAKPAI